MLSTFPWRRYLGGLAFSAALAAALPGAAAGDDLDLAALEDLDDRTSVVLVRMRRDYRSRGLKAEAVVVNDSTGPLASELYLVLESAAPAGVTVGNAHGTTLSGRPFYRLASQIEFFNVDGVVYHDAKTCPYNTNCRYGMPQRIEARTGLPSLIIHGDLNDLRLISDEQTHTNVEAFVEQLEEKKAKSITG